MNQNPKIAKALERYEKDCLKAIDRLIDQVQPFLNSACDRWGWTFISGNGTWLLEFADQRNQVRLQKDFDGRCVRIGDPTFLMDFLEPELSEALDSVVENRQSLGSLMADYKPITEFDWVVIEADEWCLDREVELPAVIAATDLKKDGMTYFGLVPRHVAELVVKEFNQDWDSGSQLLGSLPDFQLNIKGAKDED